MGPAELVCMVTALDRVMGLGGKTEAVFFRNLATMIQSGLAWVGAVGSLKDQYKGSRLGRLLAEVQPQLMEGSPLSDVLEKYPYFFSPFVVAMLRAGERGGTIDRCLLSLADHLERQHQAKMDLIVKLVYPMVVVHCALVIPPIPLLVTKTVGAYLAVVLPALFSLWGAMLGWFLINRLGASVLPLREVIDSIVMNVPGVGRFVRASAAIWFLRSLAELYEAGTGAARAVSLAARACGNLAMAKRYEQAVTAIDNGATLTQALTQRGLLPVSAVQTLSIAEQSGTVGTSIKKTADMLEMELRAALNTMAVALPILIFIPIGIYVGYNLIQMVHSIYPDELFKF